jgi:DtxR family Mn-dependent transcriptional regulator
MALLESGEMYLETILILSRERSIVRSVDVADRMNFSKPSVSRAMGLLKNDEFIEIDGKGGITLTESGRARAENIYERHRVLTKMLESLGVDPETATEDACKMEHYISQKSFDAIKEHMRDRMGSGT